MNATTRVFDRWERHVMARLGISDRDLQREMRSKLLVEGDDWLLQKNRILYSALAEEKLAHHLSNLPQGDLPHANHTPSEQKPLPGGNTDAPLPIARHVSEFSVKKTERLTVLKPGFILKNHHVLECRLENAPKTDPVQIVRVRDNRNFIPGTKTGVVLAIHEHGRIWQFAGNPDAPVPVARCPRWKGKW
jgi:hypothetical protein